MCVRALTLTLTDLLAIELELDFVLAVTVYGDNADYGGVFPVGTGGLVPTPIGVDLLVHLV